MRTPIDILREKYFETGMLYETDFNEADAMHKEQHEETWAAAWDESAKSGHFENYYNETFGGKDE